MLVLESLFCLFPPLYFGKDATTIQCVFFGGHTDFFLQCVLSVSEYIKSLIGRLIFPLYTLCSLNGNCDCDPTTDSIVHLILVPRKRLGFVIPKTFPQFGYEMIIKKNCSFFPFWSFSILIPNSTWALQRLLLRSCHVQSCEECLHNKTPKSE